MSFNTIQLKTKTYEKLAALKRKIGYKGKNISFDSVIQYLLGRVKK